MEKLTFDNMLSWQDIFSLGNPFGEGMHYYNREVLRECACDNKYKKSLFNDEYQKHVLEEFYKLGIPRDIPIECYDFGLKFEEKEDGKWHAVFSKVAFFASVFSLNSPDGDDKYFEIANELLKYEDEEEFKEEIIRRLKEIKLAYINGIRDIESGKNPLAVQFLCSFTNNINPLSAFRSGRTQANWLIKNYDEVINFLNSDYPMELFECLNKDRFMNLLCSSFRVYFINDMREVYDEFALKNARLNDKDKENLKKLLNYTHNYLLIADYISKENNSEYNNEITLPNPTKGIVKPDTKHIRDFYSSYICMFEDADFLEYSSYEELLGAKAKETWERITNKKLVMNIKVNFEMIKSGKKDVYNMDRKAPRVTSSKEKRAAQLKQAYDLLDEKFAYYESKNPVVTLSGISNFVGYFAQFYENGCVVLDKYYRLHIDRKGKEVVVPASGEAIYIMNYEEFANLCQCTKPELIEEKNNNNPNVDRKNHTKNWRKNLDSIIDGEGYGGLNLNFLNQLTLELTGESVKEKKKTNE